MSDQISYTIEEISKLLKVSKLTVYDLIKKGEISAYRVGRQMRIDANDLDAYKNRAKMVGGGKPQENAQTHPGFGESPFANLSLTGPLPFRPIIISGQDHSLDILALHLEKNSREFRPLRSYTGGLSGLMALYRGETDLVATHLLDGDTGEYNIPYIKKILIGFEVLVVNLVIRRAGIYVKKGNPKNILSWGDFAREDVIIANREKGAGARVLLDEQLRLHGIQAKKIKGYEKEEGNHLVVAAMIASGEADAGVGTEKAAIMADIDFIPMVNERYDLVMINKPENQEMIDLVLSTLQSKSFLNELKTIGGYDLSHTGQVLYDN